MATTKCFTVLAAACVIGCGGGDGGARASVETPRAVIESPPPTEVAPTAVPAEATAPPTTEGAPAEATAPSEAPPSSAAPATPEATAASH